MGVRGEAEIDPQQSHCTYWSADGRMKLIFWGRQCRHISFSRCKAILRKGSGANLVHLDRLWSQASANCTVSDGWPIHHDLLPVSPPWYLHCHWCDTPSQWWIADSMHYDKIERSVCTAHRPVISMQLGTHHSYKASLFNIQATVWGPCGEYPSTCLINVASLARLLQSSSPLSNNYSINRAQPNEQVKQACSHNFHDVHSSGKRYILS